MILSPEAGVPQCPCYTAWTDPLYGMATSCCMVLYILRTPQLTEHSTQVSAVVFTR